MAAGPGHLAPGREPWRPSAASCPTRPSISGIPTRSTALLRAFCAANPRHFHAADGSGYRFAADVILQLDPLNPQVASRIARSFDRWRKFDAGRQAHAREQLQRIQAQSGLSGDVAEVVGKSLGA